MKCRHCLVEFHVNWSDGFGVYDKDTPFHVWYASCPACGRLHVAYGAKANGTYKVFLFPRSMAREPVPAEFRQNSLMTISRRATFWKAAPRPAQH